MRIIVSALQGKLNKDVFWITQDFSFCQLNIFFSAEYFYIQQTFLYFALIAKDMS